MGTGLTPREAQHARMGARYVPAERLADVAAGDEGLHGLAELEVRHGDLVVVALDPVLGGYGHALPEEVRVDGHAVLLGDQHVWEEENMRRGDGECETWSERRGAWWGA